MDEADRLADLFRALRITDGGVRKSVAQALIRARGAAVPGLIEAFADEDADVRLLAVRALCLIPGDESTQALRNAQQNEDAQVRLQALQELDRRSVPDILDLLLHALHDNNKEVRKQALTALGERKVHRAVPPVIDTLRRDPAFAVRCHAAVALADIRNPAAVGPLLEALNDEDVTVRIAVAWALGELRDARAIPHLIELLEDDEVSLRRTGIWSLRAIGKPEAAPALIAALEDPDEYTREAAAEALGTLRSEAAVPALLDAVGDARSNVQQMAIWALGEIGSEPAVAGLIALLRTDERTRLTETASALTRAGKTAIPAIVTALNDAHPNARRFSVLALAAINGTEPLPSLLDATQNDDSYVRAAAAYGLRYRQQEGFIPRLVDRLADTAFAWFESEGKQAAAPQRVCDVALITLKTISPHHIEASVWAASLPQEPPDITAAERAEFRPDPHHLHLGSQAHPILAPPLPVLLMTFE